MQGGGHADPAFLKLRFENGQIRHAACPWNGLLAGQPSAGDLHGQRGRKCAPTGTLSAVQCMGTDMAG